MEQHAVNEALVKAITKIFQETGATEQSKDLVMLLTKTFMIGRKSVTTNDIMESDARTALKHLDYLAQTNTKHLQYLAGRTLFRKAKDGEQAVRANGDWVREMEYAGSLGALGQVSWLKWVEDCFATRLTPSQAGDPAFCHLQRRGSYLDLTQKQHSFLGHMFYKHIGHKDFAMFIFKHGLPEILTTQHENASDDDMISVMQWYGRYAAYREQNVQRGSYTRYSRW